MIRKAYIISAKSDHQKRIVLEKRFHDVGLEPHFIDSVMGKDLSPSQKSDFVHSDRQNWLPTVMQDNALGCALSHHKIWELIANGDQDYGLICEDDALPLPETSDHITTILDHLTNLDQLIDIVFLARRFPNRKTIPIYKLAHLPPDHEFRLTLVKYNSIGAECYLLSRQAARTLLENKYRHVFEVDCMLHHWWLNGCNVLHINPPLFAEEGRPSTIGYMDIQPWPYDHIGHKLKRKWHRIHTSFTKRMRFHHALKQCRDLFSR